MVGSDRDCDIVLPYPNFVSGRHLELSCDPKGSKWYLKDLESAKGTFVDNRRIPSETLAPIKKPTRIDVGGGAILMATLAESDRASTPLPRSLETSTRLLCGWAYLGGMFSGFELLNQLRNDPYKAQIPSSSLDLDKIARHATQSIVISLGCAVFALLVFVIQLFVIPSFLKMPGLIGLLNLAAAFAIAYELVYMRWSRAYQFLKKNYKHYDSEFMVIKEPRFRRVVDFFQNQVFRRQSVQNIITFAGSNPFLGAGEVIPGSTWTVPINRKKVQKDSEEKPQEFVYIPTDEFYRIADEEVAQLHLPNLQKLSQLFVDGFELEPDNKILKDPTVPPAVVSFEDPLWIPETHSSQQRAYRLYKYVDIERDYVLSFFLRFYNAGTITFVESSAYILPGIDRQRFGLTSVLDDDEITIIIKTVLATAVLASGLYVLWSFLHIGKFVVNVVLWKWNDFKQRRAAEFQEEYNYGLQH